MALKRNVGLRGIGYRGGGPMLSWTLHRIGGLAMVLFVGLHIAVGFFMQQFDLYHELVLMIQFIG